MMKMQSKYGTGDVVSYTMGKSDYVYYGEVDAICYQGDEFKYYVTFEDKSSVISGNGVLHFPESRNFIGESDILHKWVKEDEKV